MTSFIRRVAIAIALSATIVLSLAAAAAAQRPSNWEGHASFAVGVPQGAFRDEVSNAGIGGFLGAAYSPDRSPFSIGVEFGYMNYGVERRQEPFSTTIPDVTVNVQTTNNIALGNIVLRARAGAGPIVPFVEGVAGFKYLFTQTQIENRMTQEPIAASTNFDDWAWSYGAGAGVQVRIWENRGQLAEDDEAQNISSVSLELKGRYLLGTEAEYLRRGSIRRENGQVSFDVHRSTTDLLLIQLGVTVRF